MLEDIIKTALEADIKNAGAIILSLVLGFTMYLRGAEVAKQEKTSTKSDLQKVINRLQKEEDLEQLTLQQLQASEETINNLERQQEELVTSITIIMELMKSSAAKIDSINTSVEVLKELLRGK